MKTKWTKGPWYFGPMHGWMGVCIMRRHPSEYWEQGVIGDAPIAQIKDGAAHWENKYPVEANAHLIAAAPELYEALQRLMHSMVEDLSEWGYIEEDFAEHDALNVAKAALAKARGEQQ